MRHSGGLKQQVLLECTSWLRLHGVPVLPYCSLEGALYAQLAAAEGKDRSAREADAAAAADKLAKAEGRLRALRAEGLPKVR
jgi:hypothetical protein